MPPPPPPGGGSTTETEGRLWELWHRTSAEGGDREGAQGVRRTRSLMCVAGHVGGRTTFICLHPPPPNTGAPRRAGLATDVTPLLPHTELAGSPVALVGSTLGLGSLIGRKPGSACPVPVTFTSIHVAGRASSTVHIYSRRRRSLGLHEQRSYLATTSSHHFKCRSPARRRGGGWTDTTCDVISRAIGSATHQPPRWQRRSQGRRYGRRRRYRGESEWSAQLSDSVSGK